MNVWKRNAVVAAVVLFVCGAVYLNWSYQKGQSEEAGKTLGEAELVSMQSADPLLKTSPAPSADPSASPAPTAISLTAVISPVLLVVYSVPSASLVPDAFFLILPEVLTR